MQGSQYYLSQDVLDILEFLLLSHWGSELRKMRDATLTLVDSVENKSELRKFNVELGALQQKIESLLAKLEEKSCI